MKLRTVVAISHPQVAAGVVDELERDPRYVVLRATPSDAAERAREWQADVVLADPSAARELPRDLLPHVVLAVAGEGSTASTLATELGAVGWLFLDEVADGLAPLLAERGADESADIRSTPRERRLRRILGPLTVGLASAALIAIALLLGALALVGWGGLRFAETVGAQPAQSLAATPSAVATQSPAPQTTPAPTVAPSPKASPVAELSALLRALAPSWRPRGTTVILEQSGPLEQGATLVAIPLPSGTPAPIVALGTNAGWDLRVNGTQLVVALQTGARATRLALLDLQKGESRWLTNEDAGSLDRNPVWSPDGAFIYVGRSTQSADLGLFRMRADGTELSRIRGPAAGAVTSAPVYATADAVLVFAESTSGRTAIGVLDLQTRGERRLGADGARFDSWRLTRPRALLERLGPTSLPDPASAAAGLLLVDDLAGTTTTLLSSPTLGADWDPNGTRVVAAARIDSGPFGLVTMDASGGGGTIVTGSENATRPLWLRAGIVYVWDAQPGDQTQSREVRLIAPSGGTPRTLYRAEGFIQRIQFVSP